MAKTISLEFTDKQWELIQANYPIHDATGDLVDFTEEGFNSTLISEVRTRVTAFIQDKVNREHQNDFDA